MCVAIGSFAQNIGALNYHFTSRGAQVQVTGRSNACSCQRSVQRAICSLQGKHTRVVDNSRARFTKLYVAAYANQAKILYVCHIFL